MNEDRPLAVVQQALVCDDIRREANGKEILIGVYGEEIVVAQFPANLLLFVWVRLKSIRPGNVEASFRVIDEKGESLAGEARASFKVTAQPLTNSISVGGIPLQFTGTRRIYFQMRQWNDDWQVVQTALVRAPFEGEHLNLNR